QTAHAPYTSHTVRYEQPRQKLSPRGLAKTLSGSPELSTFCRSSRFRQCETAPQLLPQSAGWRDIFRRVGEMTPRRACTDASVPVAVRRDKAHQPRGHLWGGV